MSASDSAWLNDAFRSVRDDFIKELKNPQRYDFTKFGSINDVYDATDEIQKEQTRTKTLRGLRRLEPLLQALKEFSGTIEVFVQAKPEILALIWGPLKLLLQLSSSLTSAFEKVVKVLGEIGDTLPLFQRYASLFKQNGELKRVLCLFYGDILEFYKILLNFVQDRRLKTFLEMLWPNIRSKIKVVQENMTHHKALMTDQVTLEHILQSFQARNQAVQEYERAQAFRDSQYFEVASARVAPHLYDGRLAEIEEDSSVKSGGWLFGNVGFKNWIDPRNSLCRCIWLCGIPGSGKTFLTANIIRHISSPSNLVLFVFLTHENQELSRIIKVLHSLLFQASSGNASLRAILSKEFESNSNKISNDVDHVKKLIVDILNDCGPTSIVVDGLDELEDRKRQALLKTLLDVVNLSQDTNLLISSRAERDIEKALEKKALVLRVDHHNMEDIRSYVDAQCGTWLAELQDIEADKRMLDAVRESVSVVSSKCQGMFLWTKLILQALRDQVTASGIRAELENLPEGLDQAYGRILTRIDKKLLPSMRSNARRILQWIACAKRPLHERELFQILVLEPGAEDFVEARKACLDIRAACGPIIETIGGIVRFVHFSAKEYITDSRSSFLNLDQANFEAAMACSGYLCYASLNILFHAASDHSELNQRIVNGDLVFFDYAANMWLQHIIDIGRNRPPEIGSLSRILSRLFDTRAAGLITETETPKSFLGSFEIFDEEPRIQRLLANTYQVHGRVQYGLLDDAVDPSVTNTDPLQLFHALSHFRRNLELSYCGTDQHRGGCSCSKLHAMYGPPIFYCDKPFCSKYRLGFALRAERDQHLSSHKRPHKCPQIDCIYSEYGFSTQHALAHHKSSAHPQGQASAHSNARTTNKEGPPNVDLNSILEDAIIHSELDLVRALIAGQPDLVIKFDDDYESFATSEYRKKHPYDSDRVYGFSYSLCLAAWRSNPDVLGYLLNASKDTPNRPPLSLEPPLATAIETKNLPNIRFLLSKGASMSEVAVLNDYFQLKIIHKARESYITQPTRFVMGGFSRALSLWDPDLMEYLTVECNVTIPSRILDPGSIFLAPAIRGLAAEEVTRRFAALRRYLIWPGAFDEGVRNAVGSRSVLALKICLENGGNVDSDFRGRTTVLGRSVELGTAAGAEMAFLLLKYGANPHITGLTGRTISKRKIEAYYGLPWDEIIRRAKAGEELARRQ